MNTFLFHLETHELVQMTRPEVTRFLGPAPSRIVSETIDSLSQKLNEDFDLGLLGLLALLEELSMREISKI